MFTLISAVLAFAITMFFLSTVAAIMVETIHRALQQREKGLELMLAHFYDRVIAPALNDGAKSLKQDFVELMSVNRAPSGAGLQFKSDFSQNDKTQDRWTWLWNGRRLASLPVNDFMNRLGSSPFGDTLSAKLAQATDESRKAVLADIAAKFESYGADASAFFQSRARLFSVLIAVAVAYTLHVHPLELFSAYLESEEKSATVIALRDQLTKATSETDRDTIKSDMKQLEDAKVPIGWDDASAQSSGFFIWKEWGVPIPVPCFGSDAGGCKDSQPAAQVPTLIWLLLGGLLVGLGGPFWKSVIDQLTPVSGKPKDGGEATGSGSSGNEDQPATPVEHFETAAKSRSLLLPPTPAPAVKLAVD
jgi:hypothetical protein